MPASFVHLCQEVIDRDKLETCWSKFGPTLDGHQPRSVAAGAPFQQPEGLRVGGVAVIESASPAAARGWYKSSARRAIRYHREAGARCIGLRFKGGATPFGHPMPHANDRHPARAQVG